MEMEVYLKQIKTFLDCIPQFLSDLEPEDDYLLLPGTSFWKMLMDYTIDPLETEDGYSVNGSLRLLIEDAKQLPEWKKYAEENPELSDDAIFDLVAHERPSVCTPFDLEDFCDHFEEAYFDFLDENGLDPNFIEIDGDRIRVVRD